jgi:hypothetical protein
MKTIPYTDDAAKKIVKRFSDQVFWLRVVRHVYEELFENEESQILMERTAPSFFADLSTVLHNYLLLEFVKITDPAKSGKKENFTLDNLIESIDWPQDTRERLRSLSEKTKGFRKHTLDARNKLLAHTDKEVFLTETSLGEFPEREDEVFLRTLEEVCDITHELCFNRIFGHIVVAKAGDVVNFKRALRNAVAFDSLLSQSTGQEKTRLFSYLQKTITGTSPNTGTNGGLKT